MASLAGVTKWLTSIIEQKAKYFARTRRKMAHLGIRKREKISNCDKLQTNRGPRSNDDTDIVFIKRKYCTKVTFWKYRITRIYLYYADLKGRYECSSMSASNDSFPSSINITCNLQSSYLKSWPLSLLNFSCSWSGIGTLFFSSSQPSFSKGPG